MSAERALPDRGDRDRIVTDLDRNLLVEAGAGSGKTRALVERMIALVRDRGVEVDAVAAVTFTRKAASELRERFQSYLEKALGDPDLPASARDRVDRALRSVDRAFIGTIHSFCARLLRERPLEAGLDPAFSETFEDEEARLCRKFWDLHLERVAAAADPALAELARVGLAPRLLYDLYVTLQANPDVRFEPEGALPPDPAGVAAVRAELGRLLDRAAELIPHPCPHPKGPDRVQGRLKRALFLRRITDWRDERDFFDALGELAGKKYDCTYVRWSGDPAVKEEVKRLETWCGELLAPGGRGAALMEQWWAHRYPVAIRFARDAARAYARHRQVAGRLNFNDLLMHTAALLRRSPRAREDLGRRYRYLLVDEFQDTDPVQAEVAFLLASPAEQGTRWEEVEPRSGQLFVVGDPKQSIYRFRRADMAVYDTVRRRFEAFGDVLRLTANFRSAPAIGALVNDTFPGDERFPDEPTPYQAAFAPLLPQPPEEPRAVEGVFHYACDPPGSSKNDVARDDAARLAAWIARRSLGDHADRSPGDFLVLTWGRRRLPKYVRALEGWGLPVQVSGAGVTAEAELHELMVLLRALIDPGDPVATVAALSGVFFGLDAERLLSHRERGGRFDLRMPLSPKAGDRGGDGGDPDVLAALTRLRGWWRRGRSEPADLVVGEIVESLGLVPWAASGDLGQLRAGALLYGLDAVRAAALDGDASLAGALDALEGVVEAREAEASLEPGRRDAVRVMNLHKAKGLEAPVVILAAPFEPYDPKPTMHVQRGDGRESLGWLVVRQRSGYKQNVVARPLDWEKREREETLHQAAEDVRLRYVAATRARDELVVARFPARDGNSPWALLHPWLDEHAVELDLPREAPPSPRILEVPGDAMRRRVLAVEGERALRSAPTYRFDTATARAKASPGEEGGSGGRSRSGAGGEEALGGPQMELFAAPPSPRDAAGGHGPEEDGPASPASDPERPGLHQGPDWGSAVHATLEAAARGAEGNVLRSMARAHLLEYERPVDEGGEPVELPRLLETVEAVRGSDVWRRAERAQRRLAEVPFARELPDEEVPTWLDGQVDLAFREADGWVLVDWKTDVDPSRRVAAYRRQLRVYGEAWEEVTGEPVKELLILFTRTRTAQAV
ncbi:MAG: UvrD-helicase domain-containing protein [Gemmatimonadota bacterium]|jgi:ATP-dependent helicase/nuclease subunit A